jgi:hypothetical protein
MGWQDPAESFGSCLTRAFGLLLGGGFVAWGIHAMATETFRSRRFVVIYGSDAVLMGAFLCLTGLIIVSVVVVAWLKGR